jgi:hypothetical protein
MTSIIMTSKTTTGLDRRWASAWLLGVLNITRFNKPMKRTRQTLKIANKVAQHIYHGSFRPAMQLHYTGKCMEPDHRTNCFHHGTGENHTNTFLSLLLSLLLFFFKKIYCQHVLFPLVYIWQLRLITSLM